MLILTNCVVRKPVGGCGLNVDRTTRTTYSMHARSKSMVLKTVLATDRIPYETIPRSADAGVEDASEYSERLPVPPTFSLLHSREIPNDGGATSYASQVMAAAELPDDLRTQVDGILVKHDSTYGSSGLKRPGMVEPVTPIDAIGHPHPVLRRVPATGQEALFLGRRTNAYVMGMKLDESEALLDELWEHATQPRFRYVHDWAIGQVVVWDNRMLLHHRNPFDASERRFMWRTQTRGEAVIPA